MTDLILHFDFDYLLNNPKNINDKFIKQFAFEYNNSNISLSTLYDKLLIKKALHFK